MNLDLEALALRLHEERMRAAVPKEMGIQRERWEHEPRCLKCDASIPPRRNVSRDRQKLCSKCRAEGWRTTRCECGGLLHDRDLSAGKSTIRKCGACRKAMHLDNADDDSLSMMAPDA